MMRSFSPWMRRILLLSLALIVLLSLSVFWLLQTESGTNKLIRFALSQQNIPVQIERIGGTLGSGLNVSGIAYKSGDVTVEIKTLQLELRLSQLIGKKVIVDRLRVSDVLVVQASSEDASRVVNESITLPKSIELPVDIVLRDVELTRLSYGATRESAELLLSRIGLSASWIDRQLSVADIEVQATVGQLAGSAEVETALPYALRVQLSTNIKLGTYPELVSETTLGGTLQDMQVEHSSAAPYGISVSGVVQELVEAPSLNVAVRTRGTQLEEIVGENLALVLTSDIELKGPVTALNVTGTANTNLPEVGAGSVSFQSLVSPAGLELSELILSLPEVGEGATLGATGTIDWDKISPVLDLRVSWDRIPWPLRGEPIAAGVVGSALLKGSLDDYSINLDSGLESALQQDGSLSASVTGSSDGFDIQSLVIKALEGEVRGNGKVRFDNGFLISAELEGANVNPRTFLPDWPGEIDFKTNATARIADSSLTVSLPELTASGKLRGYPVNAVVSGELLDKNLILNDLNLTTGSTRLTASGEVSDQIGLSWAIESEDLASLWPELGGMLDAEGQLTGTKDQPLIDATIDGSALVFREITVEALTAVIKLGQSDTYEGTALIDASDIKMGSYASQSLKVEATGLKSSHTLNISLKDTLGDTQLVAVGVLNDNNDYSLELREAGIESPDLGTWSLTEPVTAVMTQARTEVPRSCLTQADSKLCFALISGDQDMAAEIEVVDVPLSLFAYVLPTTVKASGTINGGGNLVVSTNDSSYGKLQFDVDGLMLQSRIRKETRESTLSFSPALITADVTQTGTISARASFPLISGGGVSFEGSLLEQGVPLLDRTLDGELSVAVPSVAFVSEFVPQISGSKGSLEGLIKLSGSVRNPELLGSLELQNGQLTLADPGVQVTDVSLRLTGNQNRTVAIVGSASSGGGEIKLDGQVRLAEEGNSGEFKLEGTEFKVLNTSDAQVWATPDVALAYSDSAGLKLTGSVSVPRAKVEIDALPKGAVKVSKDQVIVGQVQKEEAFNMPLNAELELVLGDDVYLSAFGLDTFLQGSLTLIEESGRPTSANGEIQLRDGKYEAYGQSLNVTTGNLIYAGGAIDEPGVDFRAVRKPVPEVEVGISARGTLNQPSFSVFSTPSMSESDQLAYLIFGRPMNADAASENSLITRLALSLGMQGGEALSQKLAGDLGVDQLGIESQGSGDLSQASLVIGKYLSPKLFVSYGIGLLEPVSTLKLEYALSSKWQLITESSTTRNSADAQYTFER